MFVPAGPLDSDEVERVHGDVITRIRRVLEKADLNPKALGLVPWTPHRLSVWNTYPYQPIAALLADLKRLGMLEETLAIWGGEFGRTPYAQGMDGREHNHRGFTTWMAGSGIKGGTSYGATDELGIEAVDGRMSIHDWYATILHLTGLDHERLTYDYAGRDFRLTDVHGEVPKEIPS